jgi:hypothetical protein
MSSVHWTTSGRVCLIAGAPTTHACVFEVRALHQSYGCVDSPAIHSHTAPGCTERAV